LRYRIVDVFTERRFEGNSLCVVLEACLCVGGRIALAAEGHFLI
jgi:predicted PhzF superfamily epimerase YddE/YHI9